MTAWPTLTMFMSLQEAKMVLFFHFLAQYSLKALY